MFDLFYLPEKLPPGTISEADAFRIAISYFQKYPDVLDAAIDSKVLDEDFNLADLCPNPHSCDRFPCETLCCLAQEIIIQKWLILKRQNSVPT